jgi:IclR family transcriptional regulator, KDG regulon repressor
MDKDVLGTLVKAIDVLTVLANDERELGASELAKAMDMPKATVYRILSTLEEKGFVRKDRESAKYQLGLALWELGRKAVDRLQLRPSARPWLEQLTASTQETSLFVVHDGSTIVYLDRVLSPQLLQISPGSLGLAPLHFSAAGKIFLAFEPEAFGSHLERASNEAHSPQARFDAPVLMTELAQVRKQGWAASIREWRPEMSSIAAPVWKADGALAGAIVLSGPADRFAGRRFKELAADVVSAARATSMDLGHQDLAFTGQARRAAA